MHTPDGRFAIIYNGEIYNYRDLRAELEQGGTVFRTGSDTEVLLHLFARDGLSLRRQTERHFCLRNLGQEARTLSLARDHLGVKPLYYAALPGGLLFASELKALTLCTDLPRDLDPATVGDHLGYLWTAGNTMLKCVKKLRPGCTLTVSANGVILKDRFYRTPQFDPDVPPSDPDPARCNHKSMASLPTRWSRMWRSARCCPAG